MKKSKYTIKMGFYMMLVWQISHVVLSIAKKKPISRELLLYATMFLIAPIIFEGFKLFINYLKKKELP